MNKKLIVIVGIVFLFAISGVVIYYYFFSTPKTPAEETLEEVDLNPFGENSFIEPKETDVKTDENAVEEIGSLPVLRKISSAPVSGATVFNRNQENLVRYLERATGHIYEAGATTAGNERISNTTIPKIYEAVWNKSGKEVFARYIKDGQNQIDTFSIKVATSSEVSGNPLQGTFFPKNINALAINPSGDRVFYILNDSGNARGFVSRLDGSQKTSVWSSPASGWLASWPNDNIVALVTKPSALASGFLYFLNTKTEKFERVLGDYKGLNALVSPNRAYVLFSFKENGNQKMSVLELKTGKIFPAPLESFADKCVWQNNEVVYCGVPKELPEGDFPDVWYQGLISFTDNVWKFDVAAGSANLLIDLEKEGGEVIDVINPQISQSGDIMIFVNKNDLSLWSLNLAEN